MGYQLIQRVMEKETGIQLDWYFNYWLNTTKVTDYGIREVEDHGDTTYLTIERKEQIPMPLEVRVEFKDGSVTDYYIPLRMMRGMKEKEDYQKDRVVLADWPWTYPEYEIAVPVDEKEINAIEIDPSGKLADVDRENNRYPVPDDHKFRGGEK